jgi:hypothetical protein
LKGPDCRLGLGRIEAIDRAWVKAEGFQVRFRDLDVS